MVSAGGHIGGDALFVQSHGLGVEIFHGPGLAVGAQNAQDGGDTAPDQLGEPDLGGPGVEAALAAAAGDVDMLVDDAGNQGLSCPVDHLAGNISHIDVLGDALDLLPADQHIPPPQIFGIINFRVSN